MAGDLQDVWRAPAAWAKDAGVDGSQRPLWLLFVLAVGAIAGMADLLDEPTLLNAAFAVGCTLGFVAIELWLVRWYRRRGD